MTRKNESDEESPDYLHEDDYIDSDHGSTHGEDEDIVDAALMHLHDNITFDDVKIRPVCMKRLKVGDTVLCVFSNGAIRRDSFENTSFGFPLAGTPYRTYTVEYQPHEHRTYYMHELVWQAFRGFPPPGWEVRHKPEHTMYSRKMYSNALHHITIFPSMISKLI